MNGKAEQITFPMKTVKQQFITLIHLLKNKSPFNDNFKMLGLENPGFRKRMMREKSLSIFLEGMQCFPGSEIILFCAKFMLNFLVFFVPPPPSAPSNHWTFLSHTCQSLYQNKYPIVTMGAIQPCEKSRQLGWNLCLFCTFGFCIASKWCTYHSANQRADRQKCYLHLCSLAWFQAKIATLHIDSKVVHWGTMQVAAANNWNQGKS